MFVVGVGVCGDYFSVTTFGTSREVVGFGQMDHSGLVIGAFGRLCAAVGGRFGVGECVDCFLRGWYFHNCGHCDSGRLCLLCHHARQ